MDVEACCLAWMNITTFGMVQMANKHSFNRAPECPSMRGKTFFGSFII